MLFYLILFLNESKLGEALTLLPSFDHKVGPKYLIECLQTRTHIVSIEHDKSSPLGIDTVIPQGSILGLPFIMHVSDLHSLIQSSKIKMYADDTVLYYSASSLPETEMKLNLD